LPTILWQIRFPKVLLAALVGASLPLRGLVFQGMLHNPLADPYVLGISGGAAMGAIIGIILGLASFPGVATLAFLGSMGTIGVVILLTPREMVGEKNALLLSGVMVNTLYTAMILFAVTITQDARLHTILYWLIGDLSVALPRQIFGLGLLLLPSQGELPVGVVTALIGAPLFIFLLHRSRP
jgi:iron complex transport system permease protein